MRRVLITILFLFLVSIVRGAEVQDVQFTDVGTSDLNVCSEMCSLQGDYDLASVPPVSPSPPAGTGETIITHIRKGDINPEGILAFFTVLLIALVVCAIIATFVVMNKSRHAERSSFSIFPSYRSHSTGFFRNIFKR